MKYEVNLQKFTQTLAKQGVNLKNRTFISKAEFSEVRELYVTPKEIEIIFEYLDHIGDDTISVSDILK